MYYCIFNINCQAYKAYYILFLLKLDYPCQVKKSTKEWNLILLLTLKLFMMILENITEINNRNHLFLRSFCKYLKIFIIQFVQLFMKLSNHQTFNNKVN